MNKLLHLVILVLFGYFIYVQFNDVDGWKWVIIYSVVAFLPILKLLDKKISYFALGLVVAFTLALIFEYHLLNDWLAAGKPEFIDYEPTNITEVEGIREYLGIGICFLTTLLYSIFEWRKKKS